MKGQGRTWGEIAYGGTGLLGRRAVVAGVPGERKKNIQKEGVEEKTKEVKRATSTKVKRAGSKKNKKSKDREKPRGK